ncbi:TetR/AcrR family transcriptional regulator C-terminal ligand-binding domain-containing protein [Pleomorphomonas sp. PLEO]|uniref:TetR/AcrR family transcriptional regulator n=1 Tax=Pleomorphomonas sp. PLEO TaxID=3239306 RepID=UPI00351F0033
MSKSEDSNSPQPGRPRDKSLDEALIRITLELLRQTGLESVTMSKIGRLSGIPATSIYRRYPDAHSLIVAAIKDDLEKMQLLIADQGSLRGDILAFLRIMAEALNQDRARILSGMLLPMQGDPELAALFTTKLEALRCEGWRGVIERAVRRGTLRAEALDACPLDEVAQAMIFYQAAVKFEPADEAFLNDLLDTVLMPGLERFQNPDPQSAPGSSEA